MRADEYFKVHLKRVLCFKLTFLHTAQSYFFFKTPFSNMHVASLLRSAAEPNVSMRLRNYIMY